MEKEGSKEGEEFHKAVKELKEAVERINQAVEPHVAEASAGWGSNPLFSFKLEVHRQLLSLVEEQKKLSEGIVALLQAIDDYAEKKKSRPPIPPPPSPGS